MSETLSSESASPPDKIYFKDKKGEQKGPFTERQVQEWYREKWFDTDFNFYFMIKDEEPTATSTPVTLGMTTDRSFRNLELITRFGSCCPFRREEERGGGNRCEELENRIGQLEKELAALQKECDRLRAFDNRLAELEMKMQTLESPDLNKENVVPVKDTAAALAAVKIKTQPEPAEGKHTDEKWYDELVALVVESFEMLRGRDFSRAHHITTCAQMKKGITAFEGDKEAQGKFVETVMKKMRESKEYYHCAKCDSYFLQPKQAFHHLMQEEHVRDLVFSNNPLHKLTNAVVRLVDYTVLTSFTKESIDARLEQNKYGRLMANCTIMRPNNSFIEEHIIGKFLGGCAACRGYASKTKFFDAQIAKLKDGVDSKIEKALRTHIGDAQTYCDICNTVTGKADQYFAHLRRFDHVMKVKLFHVPTVVANRLANKE